MSEFKLPGARPRFRDLVVYQGPFDVEAISDRIFAWLNEVDPPAAERHLEYLHELADRRLGLEEIMLRSYDRLFQGLFDYCANDATWGWEPARPDAPRPEVARLGFWPVTYGCQPTLEPALDAAASGAEPDPDRRYQDLFLADAQRLIDHLERVAGGDDDQGFRLGPARVSGGPG
jgi:hypothetical protein